jgi:hypothetical protein
MLPGTVDIPGSDSCYPLTSAPRGQGRCIYRINTTRPARLAHRPYVYLNTKIKGSEHFDSTQLCASLSVSAIALKSKWLLYVPPV